MTEEVNQDVKKPGIHLVSNAVWSQTGYGGQAKLILPRFQALGYSMSMTAYYGLQGHTLEFNGMRIYPCGYHAYGMDVAQGNTMIEGAKICMTNVDIWVCEPTWMTRVLWVPWFPIDSESISPLIMPKLPYPFERIVMSKHGQGLLEKVGYPSKYVPCAIDTKVFTPVDRKAARDEVNQHIQFPIPDDKFVVSMVAMNKGNPSRKAFTQQLRAFKAFHDRYPDTVLYMHTIKSEAGEQGGVNLPAYCNFVGLDVNKDVLFPDPLTIINGYPDVFLNAVYNASDVFLSATMGEGFGVPILEAQAAGCPVIIGDWTSMSEILFSGWKVEKSESNEVWTILGAIQHDPHWQAIADRLEQAYQKRGYDKLRRDARKGALEYDIENVMEKYWKPTLEGIEQKMTIPTEDIIEVNGVAK